MRIYVLDSHGLQHARLPCPSPLLELAQTQGDAIQPSHPLSLPSPPAFNFSQHLRLFKWVSSSHQVASVLEYQLQHQSSQWIFRTDFFRVDWLDFSQSKWPSIVFSNTTVQKHQFFGTQLSVWSNSHIHTWLLENHSFDKMGWIPRSYIGASPVTGGP